MTEAKPDIAATCRGVRPSCREGRRRLYTYGEMEACAGWKACILKLLRYVPRVAALQGQSQYHKQLHSGSLHAYWDTRQGHKSPPSCLTLAGAAGSAPAAKSVRRASRWNFAAAQDDGVQPYFIRGKGEGKGVASILRRLTLF